MRTTFSCLGLAPPEEEPATTEQEDHDDDDQQRLGIHPKRLLPLDTRWLSCIEQSPRRAVFWVCPAADFVDKLSGQSLYENRS
jgi:hypothetical protein